MVEIEPLAYKGLKPCGCIGFVAVDDPKLAKEIAKDIEWIVSIGGKVEMVTCEEVRKSSFYCLKHKPSKQQPKLL